MRSRRLQLSLLELREMDRPTRTGRLIISDFMHGFITAAILALVIPPAVLSGCLVILALVRGVVGQ